MIYLQRNKTKKRDYKKPILIFCFFLLLVLLGYFIPKTLRTVGWAVATPIWKASDFIASPFYIVGDFFSSKNNLIAENEALKDEIAKLQLKVIDHDIILRENNELKAQMGRNSDTTRIVSRVLSKPPRSPYDTLIIDVGSKDDVVLGSKVYLSDNIIVGIVKNVTLYTSLVEMFSKGDLKQEAVVSRTGASYVLTGSGDTNFKLEVPKDADIVWGDMFMYPGLSPAVIGIVNYVDSSSQGSFKTIYLKVPGNIFSTKYLFVSTEK